VQNIPVVRTNWNNLSENLLCKVAKISLKCGLRLEQHCIRDLTKLANLEQI